MSKDLLKYEYNYPIIKINTWKELFTNFIKLYIC